ncbi:CheB methylesterase domain-containing protein [Geobacter pickeringii]|uniref:protein-glutamate methylesterase n=1 Tax=Geobacter pickeringii TaxID=345632 RepID=A0A0B5BCH4_9BACT|nr:CheB methylesterase domain-containing protein [Geobacter pickeringii]AJE02270.1 chemotaxis protein CheB [Geobacter pickeringii]
MFNNRLVVIGVSTGGPITLRELFSGMPPLDAAVVIVLHIPPGMDRLIAKGLAAVASMPVTLAEHGEYLESGRIYLAPGGYHLTFEGNRRIILREGARVNYVQPSADVAMESLSKPLRGKIVGVILTGMGKDGAAGIRHIKEIGGTTLAQDQKSCAIYGMPKAASQTGAVDFVFPPDRIRGKLVELVNGGR